MQTSNRRVVIGFIAGLLGACGGVAAGTDGDETHFLCKTDSDCAGGARCVHGECQVSSELSRDAVTRPTSTSSLDPASAPDESVDASVGSVAYCGVEIVIDEHPSPPPSCEPADASTRWEVIPFPTNDGVLPGGCGSPYGLALPAEAEVDGTLQSYEPCWSARMEPDGGSTQSGMRVGFTATCEESYFVCRAYCSVDADCPSGGSGTAEPFCDHGTCWLGCGAAVCPDGMRCVLDDQRELPEPTCWWPKAFAPWP